jgi:glutathione synthase/RimK-type ligase-like ATP-grasp enzyme
MQPDRPHVLLLATPPQNGTPHNDNHLRLETAFRKWGCTVTVLPHEAVLTAPLNPFDLIWPIGFGPLAGYQTRLRIMSQHPQWAFVNAPAAMSRLHSKDKWLTHAPETHVSEDPDVLIEIAMREGSWVLKPNVGSFGRHVIRVSSSQDIIELVDAHPGKWLLQRYLPEIMEGEYRTLITAGEIIGTYLRKPSNGFHANLNQSADLSAAQLPASHWPIVTRVLKELEAHRIRFAAVDTCGGYLMEVNVANPGGMATLDLLYGGQSADRVVASLLNAILIGPAPESSP